MSLYGMMRTGVSGMSAQANRLSTVADNIANSSTNGYKRSGTEFSSLVIPTSPGTYNSGGITTNVRTEVSRQGVLQYTTSSTDLAIDGDGFFVVQDESGTPFLTRAGSFIPDGDGKLVNAAGYQLLGYNYDNGSPVATANGYDGLVPVTVNQNSLVASASTSGLFSANLPYEADIVDPANLPSANDPAAAYSAKSSLVTYNNVGDEVMLDVYFTKTADNQWEVAVYDRAGATAGTSFPYGSGPLAVQTLDFDGSSGQLDGASAMAIDVPVPNGETMTIDLSSTSQLSSDFTVFDAQVNGNPPSTVEQVEISADGTCFAQYSDGSFRALYRIALADVQSPDNLQSMAGNVFSESPTSGQVRIGFPNDGGNGGIVSGAVENSNVDIATELTSMIESQRSYTANSKVFQTGSDLMDLLINLKR